MPHSQECLHVLKVVFSREAIGKALMLTADEVTELFRDARVTGRLAEVWGERLFRYTRHTNSNYAGSDGRIVLGPIGRYDVSVRAFNRSIKFQQSKYMGSGRTCTREDLICSLEAVETIVLVDLREFPVVAFLPLDTKPLLRLAHAGGLTPAGMSAKRFDEWIAAAFNVSVTPVSLAYLGDSGASSEDAA